MSDLSITNGIAEIADKHTGSAIREIDDIVCRNLPCICGGYHDSASERDACLAKPAPVRFKEMFGRAIGISEKEL